MSEQGPRGAAQFGNPPHPLYELCSHCDHFIEYNDGGGDPKALDIAEYIHLDDGDPEYDHDATPSGLRHWIDEWRSRRPDLFRVHADGKIGPNSRFHTMGRSAFGTRD